MFLAFVIEKSNKNQGRIRSGTSIILTRNKKNKYIPLPKYCINLSIQGMLEIAFRMYLSVDHLFDVVYTHTNTLVNISVVYNRNKNIVVVVVVVVVIIMIKSSVFCSV